MILLYSFKLSSLPCEAQEGRVERRIFSGHPFVEKGCCLLQNQRHTYRPKSGDKSTLQICMSYCRRETQACYVPHNEINCRAPRKRSSKAHIYRTGDGVRNYYEQGLGVNKCCVRSLYLINFFTLYIYKP